MFVVVVVVLYEDFWRVSLFYSYVIFLFYGGGKWFCDELKCGLWKSVWCEWFGLFEN